jgi:hypothetical protein
MTSFSDPDSGGSAARRRALCATRELVRECGEEAMDPDYKPVWYPEEIRHVLFEEMAWELLCGVEPRLSVNEEAHLFTLTGHRVLGATGVELMGAFGTHPSLKRLRWLQRETIRPTSPRTAGGASLRATMRLGNYPLDAGACKRRSFERCARLS